MKHETIYRRWVQERNQVDIPPGFVGGVMDQIRSRPSPANRIALPWSRLAERVSVSWWTQVAAVGIACVVGLIRVLLALHLLLSV